MRSENSLYSRVIDATDIMIVAPIDNCNALKYANGVSAEIAIPATSLLFLFRVKAIYNHSKIVTAFFGFLWIAIAGLSILILIGIPKGLFDFISL